MQHPLRSASATPDSATGWEAVDREIEQLAHQGRMDESKAAKLAEGADVEEGREAPPHDASDDTEALHAEAEQYIRRLDPEEQTRKVILLACACCLSIGSHYATYDLGPIKNSLGTSESGFAGFVSAIELANTVTPLVAGFLVARLGAAVCGLVATGLVFGGQVIVYFAQSLEGGAAGNLPLMVLGLLVFGAGTSPLAVVQESIILQHNDSSSHFVARSIAAGLVLGKAGSFAGAWSSEPLYAISPRLPFLVALCLTLFSFSASLLYALVERRNSRARAGLKDAAHHKPLRLSTLAYFGSPFWWYMGVCALAGTWYTTEHLSSHLLQSVYSIPEAEASPAAALVLGAPLLCYPLLGYFLDRRPNLLDKFWLAVPSLVSFTYFSYLLLGPFIPAFLAILPAALGVGSGTLLLVLVVPRIVEPDQAATALGAHKSIEMAGAIIIQTLCGRLLSLESHTHRPDEQLDEDPTWAIALLLAGSLVQVGVVARWWSVIRATARSKATSVPTEEELGLLDDGRVPSPLSSSSSESEAAARGYRCLYAATGIVVLSWVCFLSNLV
ncbi:MFS general substrate transporter [Rhodotorula sp. JG-1b]|nr:MFS general substrate transporter [Rhodotorula sp. JG-1b]